MAERNPLLTIDDDGTDDAAGMARVDTHFERPVAIDIINSQEGAIVPEKSVKKASEIGDNTMTNPPDPIAKKAIDVSKRDINAMRTIKEFLEKENISTDVNILVIGKTGQGKSALVNSLIELGEDIAPEGSDTDCCTETSQSYTYPNIIPGVSVTIIDSPGLQDTQNKEHKHIQEMENECREISLVLYCMKMTDKRFTNDDKVAMTKLNQAFGQKFWERVVFVLTFANRETLACYDKTRDKDNDDELLNDDKNLDKLKIKRLTDRVKHRQDKLNEFVTELLQLQHKSGQTKFEVLSAGYYHYNPRYDDIPPCVNWQRDLIAFCCNRVKHKYNLSKLKLKQKIALAVIVDNRGEVKMENEEMILSDEAAALQKALENLKFAVLYFNKLTSESIATLIEALSKADYSQLLMIFFSKGKTAVLNDADGVAVHDAVFHHFQICQIPVTFFFDLHVANDNIQKGKAIDDAPNDNDNDVQNENDSIDDDAPYANDNHELVQNEKDSEINNTKSTRAQDSTVDADTHNFNLPFLPNSLILAARHNSESSPVVKEFTEKLSHASVHDTSLQVQECFETICANNNSPTVESKWYQNNVRDNLFIVKSTNDSVETLEQKLEVYHSIWYPIRCKTIKKLEESREEIMSVVRKASEARLATTVSGMVLSSGLVMTGIALAPFTFGGSIAISALGGVVGAAAAGVGIGAFIASKVANKKKLKKAQQQINLDQQLSLMINKEALKYNQMTATLVPQSSALSHVPESSAISFQGVAATVRCATAGIAIGLESTIETTALALRTTGPVAGMALAGASLAVTIPIDIGFIIYHSYHLHQAKNDPTGRTTSNKAVKTLNDGIESLLKSMCHTIDEDEYEVQPGRNILQDFACGYEIHVPVEKNEQHTVAVRTLFSGPFVYPDGYTLVSAVYDITMPELSKPATIKLEHCVDESDQTRSDLCFAIGSVDFKKTKIAFEKVDQVFNGSIQQKNSCLLCVLYKGTLKNIIYAAQYLYEKKYKNFWTLKILFAKFLQANFKHARSVCKRHDNQCSYSPFFFTSDKLDLTCFKNTIDVPGWTVSPYNNEEIPDTISMQDIMSSLEDIDTAKLREGSAKVLKKAFPSISLCVYISNEAIAANEIQKSFKIGGENGLKITINQHKENL